MNQRCSCMEFTEVTIGRTFDVILPNSLFYRQKWRPRAMIRPQTQRSAYILIPEEHEHVLTHVLCFSEFSFAPPIQHKCQLFWVRRKASKRDARGLSWDIAYTVLTGKAFLGFSDQSAQQTPKKSPLRKARVLCFRYGGGICQSWINPPATMRKGEALLWSPLCYWNPDEGDKRRYLERGCPKAGWGEIHELGTYIKALGGVELLFDTMVVDTCHYTFVQIHRRYNTKSDPIVNSGWWCVNVGLSAACNYFNMNLPLWLRPESRR